MPPVTSDLRAWPENCLSSFRSEKHRPTDLDLAEDLVRSRLEDRFGFVDPQLVGPDQLHGALFLGNGGCCHELCLLSSITWRRIRVSGVLRSLKPLQAIFSLGVQFAADPLEKLVLGGGRGEMLRGPGAQIAQPALPLQDRVGINDVRAPQEHRHQRRQFRRLERIHKLVAGRSSSPCRR